MAGAESATTTLHATTAARRSIRCAPNARRSPGELEIAASTLAPRAALEAIASSRPRTVDEIMKTGGLLCWQAELVQGAVKKCLHSTR